MTPRRLLMAVLLLLSACAPRLAPMGSVTQQPALLADRLVMADGAALPLRSWLPEAAPRAVIVGVHGFNDYSNSFTMPAEDWVKDGIATYAYDQRGFGGAPNRGLWAGEAWLTGDAVAASRVLRATYPGLPLYLLGESMGGAVAILAATGALSADVAGPEGMPPAPVDGVVLSAPAVWGRATMDLLPRLMLFASARLFPDMVLTGRGLRILASDNIAMLRALARDPMVLKGARIDTVFGLVDLMDDALAAASRLGGAALLMYGAHDEIVPRRPIADFVAQLPPDPIGRRRLAYYPRGYHLLLRDLDGATVAGDVASWVLDRPAALPSRADAGAAMRPWPPPADAAAAPAMPLAEAGARR